MPLLSGSALRVGASPVAGVYFGAAQVWPRLPAISAYYANPLSSSFGSGWSVSGTSWTFSNGRVRPSASTGTSSFASATSYPFASSNGAASVRMWRGSQRNSSVFRFALSSSVIELTNYVSVTLPFGTNTQVTLRSHLGGVATVLGSFDYVEASLVTLVKSGSLIYLAIEGQPLRAYVVDGLPSVNRYAGFQANTTTDPKFAFSDFTLYNVV